MNVVNDEEGVWPRRSEEGACFINMRKPRDPELSVGCVLYKYQEARVLRNYDEAPCSRNIKRAWVLQKLHRGRVLLNYQERVCSRNIKRAWVLQK
jgi:hypothetical protein